MVQIVDWQECGSLATAAETAALRMELARLGRELSALVRLVADQEVRLASLEYVVSEELVAGGAPGAGEVGDGQRV